MNSEDGQVYSFCIYRNFLVLRSTTGCSQNINKQNVNIADKTLTDYSFLIRFHYTKSKNYLKRLYRIRHWIPMFIGTPCTIMFYYYSLWYRHLKLFTNCHVSWDTRLEFSILPHHSYWMIVIRFEPTLSKLENIWLQYL